MKTLSDKRKKNWVTVYKIIQLILLAVLVSQIIGEFIISDFRKSIDNPKQINYSEAIRKIDSLHAKLSLSEEFLFKSVQIYAESVEHFNYKKFWLSDNSIMPFYKNYLLWSLGHIEKWISKYKELGSNYFYPFETTDYKVALGRGFGICSQNSLGYSDLLKKRYNIDTKIVRLTGHVVTYYKSDSLEVFLDPSIGLGFKTDYTKIDSQLDEISRLFNKTRFYALYPNIGDLYNSEDNAMPKENGPKGYKPKAYLFERIMYFLKYISIIVLLLLIHLRKNHLLKSFA